MPYSIVTKDGITLQGIPDDVPPDSPELKARVAAIRAQRAPIPGQEGEPARVAAAQAGPGGGVVDKVIGAAKQFGRDAVGNLETVAAVGTGATTGAIGAVLGTGGATAAAILDGSFGTKQASDLIEQAAVEGMQKLTYAPRTAEGQAQTEMIGRVAQNLVPVAGVMPALAVPGAMRAAAAPAEVAAQAGAERVAGLSKTATTLPRRALEALRKPPESTATPGTMGSVGAAGTDMAAQRRATAADLPVPVNNLTKGMLSRDPAQLKFEVETAKLPEAGKPLRDRTIEINQTLLQNFDHMVDQTGAQAPSLRAVGGVVDQALVKRSRLLKNEIRARYKAAERAGQMEDPVAMEGVVAHLNDSAPSAAVAPLLNAARGHALKLGLAAEGPDGALVPQPVPLKTAELFRQAIGADTDYTPTNIRQSTIIKGLVDQATEGKGGSLYKVARAARAKYAQEFEDRAVVAKLVNTKKGMADRQVALEDVFDHSILKGSLDDVAHLRGVLGSAGKDGAQAWKELQGATLQRIADDATKSVALDSAGRRVLSPAALDKAIRVMDADGKLDFVLGKKQAQQLRDIREIAQIAKTVPPEAAINMSNTAVTLMSGMVDIAGFGMTGAPVPLMSLGRIGAKYIKDNRLRNRINDALNEQAKKQAPNRKRNAPPVQEPPPATYH